MKIRRTNFGGASEAPSRKPSDPSNEWLWRLLRSRQAVVETRCPTFSWGMDREAVGYEIVAYVFPEEVAQSAELTADTEALFIRVAGSATSWVCVSESQLYELYEREESVAPVIPGGTHEASAQCDDANDLSLTGSCEIDGDSSMAVRGRFAEHWESTSEPAQWTCLLENTSGYGYAGIARILCISVPGP